MTMGFYRQGMPRPLDRKELAVVIAPIAEMILEEIAFLKATSDCVNPDGHDFIASCGSIACPHCRRIVWL
jgi:hypothetical protein